MANKLFAEVVIAGSYKNLKRSTEGAKKELNIFEKNAKKISGAISAAFAGIALAGITALADAIMDMTKAASQDAKSMALLNKQMDNSFKATQKQKDEMNAYIDSMSNMSGIADDDLRPAMSKLVSVSKNVGKAQKSFAMVMDISAGTGKDLNVVAQAYSKYLGGNKTALDKLVPGLKDANDKMGFLQSRYQGMAKIAGENDPFARINVVLDNFKEKIGTSFLPLINGLADWLASDDAQKAMDDFAKKVQDMVTYLTSPEAQVVFKQWMEDLKVIVKAIQDMIKALQDIKPLVDTAKFLYSITPGVSQFSSIAPSISALTGSSQQTTSTTTNVYVNAPNVSGPAVVNALKTEAKRKGVPLKLLID
jgi:hypothetical protein